PTIPRRPRRRTRSSPAQDEIQARGLDNRCTDELICPSPTSDRSMGARHLDIIDDPARARAALQPIRLRLLQLLEQPRSAPQLAHAMGMPRQRVLYHLRTLEAQQLVEAQEHGSVGRRIDRSYVRTATSYAIAPNTLGGVAVDPRTVADAFSAAYLS